MRLRIASLAILALIAGGSLRADNHNTYPLPEDRGTAGIYAALQKLPLYIRVLYCTAHPDDENAGMLTWLARRAHARTALFSLTRGDGGQNILGNEKYEALGLVRTGELLEACRLYGVELYFSTAFEFGFSKSADETLAKWGHRESLEEMVRFIRRFRPSILISAFHGTAEDGHGHHQAAGILTHEAFRAAGDPREFPDQFKAGLMPCQPKKLYESAGRRGSTANNIVTIPSGEFDPILGRSPREIGTEGYSKHRTQGNGAAAATPGLTFETYKLADSIGSGRNEDTGLFTNIDTSLASILELSGSESPKVPFLKADLAAIQKSGEEAIRIFRPDRPSDCAKEISHGLTLLRDCIRKLDTAALSPPIRLQLMDALNQKSEEFQTALESVLGIYLLATGNDATVVPGQNVPVTVTLFNRGPLALGIKEAALLTRAGLSVRLSGEAAGTDLAGGKSAVFQGELNLPADTPVTQPFWYRQQPVENRFHTRETPDGFAPFDPPALSARVSCRFGNIDLTLTQPVRAQAGSPLLGSDFVDVQVVPPLSVKLEPGLCIIPVSAAAQTREYQALVRSNEKNGAKGFLKMILPPGWSVDPSEIPFSMAQKGESFTGRFKIRTPSPLSQGRYRVEAVASFNRHDYRSGYAVISYPENWTRNLYTPSDSTVQAFDVKISPGVTVAYIAGSGDEVAESIEQLGVKVTRLSADDLAFGDLRHYGAIVTGIRAYNVNEALRAHNQRLLQYVEQGGTLIVQYVRPSGRSSGSGGDFPYGPFPMSNSDEERITVEESPVEILVPTHPLLNTPNKIAAADFEGWVQERGAYFMSRWDSRYTPLLSGRDPGEPERRGGMLVARFGKGWYIYSAYSWFRQLPAGVPGAYRIFANMLSLGR